MGIKSRLLCLIILLLGSIPKIEAQRTITTEELNDSTYTCRLDRVYVLVEQNTQHYPQLQKREKAWLMGCFLQGFILLSRDFRKREKAGAIFIVDHTWGRVGIL